MREIKSRVAVNGCATVGTLGGRWCFSVRCLYRCSFMTTFSRIELPRERIPDDRIEPVDDMQTTAGMLAAGYRFECRSNTDEATDDRKERQDSQRYPHRWR